MKLTRLRLILLGVGVVGFILVWRYQMPAHPGRDVGKGGKPAVPASGPEGVRIPSMRLVGFDPARGGRLWTLTALDFNVSPNGSMITSTRLKDGQFYQNGKVVAHFSAGSATSPNMKDLELKGPIEVDWEHGITLRCGALHYASLTHRLQAEGPLTITTPDSSFSAGKLSADLALEEFTAEPTPGHPVLFTSRQPLLGALGH